MKEVVEGSHTTLPCGRPRPIHPGGSKSTEFSRRRTTLQTYLGEKGLKSSEPRRKLFDLLLAKPGHFTTQEVVNEVAKSYPGIGAATVYRSIKLLCEANLLKETLVDNKGNVVYELFEDSHHDHIVCLDCGEIFEFHDEKIESAQEVAAKRMHFDEVGHRHVIYASCTYRQSVSKYLTKSSTSDALSAHQG